MTPYERAKVLDTFLRLQREAREARKVEDAKNPQKVMQDLSLCISAGTIKPSMNPHIRLAKKRLGATIDPRETGMRTHTLKFD